MNNLYLNAIDVTPIPSHINMIALCSNCIKRDTCAFQEDYLKTATRIQWVLGDPQKDRELLENDDGFTGIPFPDNSIFPQYITAIRNDNAVMVNNVEGTFLSAKWSSFDKVKILYKIENYYVMFVATYDKEFEKFVIGTGEELYYGMQYLMQEESQEEIITVITVWREEQKQKEQSSDIDVINTTFFSARLDCSKFVQDRKNTLRQPNFKNHNNDIEDGFEFVASYHIEPNKIKPAFSSSQPVELAYPWFIAAPAHRHKKPPKRRNEM